MDSFPGPTTADAGRQPTKFGSVPDGHLAMSGRLGFPRRVFNYTLSENVNVTKGIFNLIKKAIWFQIKYPSNEFHFKVAHHPKITKDGIPWVCNTLPPRRGHRDSWLGMGFR